MATDIIDLDAYRPHLMISCGQHVHVLPVRLMLDVASGRATPQEPFVCVLQRIVVEWLACVRAGVVPEAIADLDAGD